MRRLSNAVRRLSELEARYSQEIIAAYTASGAMKPLPSSASGSGTSHADGSKRKLDSPPRPAARDLEIASAPFPTAAGLNSTLEALEAIQSSLQAPASKSVVSTGEERGSLVGASMSSRAASTRSANSAGTAGTVLTTAAQWNTPSNRVAEVAARLTELESSWMARVSDAKGDGGCRSPGETGGSGGSGGGGSAELGQEGVDSRSGSSKTGAGGNDASRLVKFSRKVEVEPTPPPRRPSVTSSLFAAASRGFTRRPAASATSLPSKGQGSGGISKRPRPANATAAADDDDTKPPPPSPPPLLMTTTQSRRLHRHRRRRRCDKPRATAGPLREGAARRAAVTASPPAGP